MTNEKDEEEITNMSIADLMNQVMGEISDTKNDEEKSGVTLMNTTTPSRVSSVSSQKAKSYLHYNKIVKSGQGRYSIVQTELVLLDDGFDIVSNAFERLGVSTGFLRACPENPRHGVLESIEVTKETLKSKWSHLRDVMRKQDPKGCMLLQPFIPATSSMVMVPNVYGIIGRDHDGTTAGKDGLTMCYLLNPNDKSCAEHFANIGHQPNEYELEYVYEKDKNYLTEKYAYGATSFTQIRGSDKHTIRGQPFTYKIVDNDDVTHERLSDVDGAVPNGVGTIHVKHIWETKGLEELAYLEEHITKDKMPEDFVISHPNGSLGSHVYAHCRTHGIPYIVGKVEIGETWVEGSPTWVAKEQGVTIDPKPYNPFLPHDLHQFNIGLERSMTQWRRQQGWFAHYFHQWISGFNMNPKHNAKLSGAFSGWLVKAAVGLCFGELRHAFSMKNDASVELAPTMVAAIGASKFIELTPQESPAPSTDRKHYYLAMEGYELSYLEMEKALRWCAKQFNTGWTGASKQFGGVAWGDCATGAADLAKSISDFMENKDEESIKRVVAHTNLAENFAHNNGSLYNKFLESKPAFDSATLAKKDDMVGWFAHTEKDLSRMFRTYEVTRTFVEHTFPSTRPINDWNTLFDYLLDVKSPMHFKRHIICSPKMFASLRDSALAIGPAWLHHKSKYTLNDVYYIPCGHEDCTKCEDKNIINISLDVGGHLGSVLLTEDAPSVFFALDEAKSSIMSYSVAQLIKAKQYNDVTPEMFVEAWEGLNLTDPMYKVLANLLQKYLSRMIRSSDTTWADKATSIFENGGGVE